MVIHTPITSGLHYNNALQMGQPLKIVQKFHLVQKCGNPASVRDVSTITERYTLAAYLLSGHNSECFFLFTSSPKTRVVEGSPSPSISSPSVNILFTNPPLCAPSCRNSYQIQDFFLVVAPHHLFEAQWTPTFLSFWYQTKTLFSPRDLIKE